MASDRVIEEIKQRLELAEYIGRTVDLKRAGRTYKACCPFHIENTPSFVVFPHTGTWHCFGACGEGGDLFSFVQKRDGLTFSEALRQLARESGVELEEETEQQRAVRSERERLVALCEAAAQQYQQWLRERPDAQACRDYLERRALHSETIHRFGLGYAPNSWDALLNVLVARGYEAHDLARVGLARERDAGGYYDALRDRLVFPIRDARGQTIGFGGRALHDEQVPKYLNSPQTPLFDKGRTLYALDLAKDTIRTAERAVIVEGYMDAIAAHQAGYGNVVASLGTALTSEQVRLLHRYSPNLTLALDADAAGQRAAERGLETVLDLQRQVRRARWERAREGQGRATEVEGDIRVLVLPQGYDPDDLLREDPARWERLVAGALAVVDFLIAQRLREADLDDPVQKARVAADLLPVIAEQDSTLVRDHYLQRLARLLHADERTLAQEMVKLMGQRREARPTAPREAPAPLAPPDGEAWLVPPPPDDMDWLPPEEPDWADAPPAPPEESGPEPHDREAYLLYLLLERPAFLREVEGFEVRSDMWRQTEHRQIWEALAQGGPASAAHLEEFIAELDAPIARHLRRIIQFYAARPAVIDEEWESEAFTTLTLFLAEYEARQARDLHYMLDDLQRTMEADPQALRQLLHHRSTIEQKRLAWQRRLHERLNKRAGQHPPNRH